MDIFAADGDIAINHATVNATLGPWSTAKDYHDVLAKSQQTADAKLGRLPPPPSLGGVLPLPRVLKHPHIQIIVDRSPPRRVNG